MSKTKEKGQDQPVAVEQSSRSRVGWFALMAAVGIAAFLVWFIVNGVDEA
jgi:hypothetical protein